MRFKGLDLNLLVVFDALATEKNVTRAADKLCLSQSATSSALSRLREFYNDELLIPTGRNFTLSIRAQELYPVIKSVLARLDQQVIGRATFDPLTADRRVRIMASDYVSQAFLGSAIGDICRKAPNLTFEIKPVDANPHIAIEKHEVDLLITPEPYKSSQHPHIHYFDDDYVCITDKKNSEYGAILDINNYAHIPHVLVRFHGSGGLSFDDHYTEIQGIRKNTVIECFSYAVIPAHIINTDRIATVPRRLATHFAAHFPLAILAVPMKIPPMKEVMQWNALNNDDALLKWLREMLISFKDLNV